MARSVSLMLAIAAPLALSSCQVPRHTQENEPKPAVAQGAAAPPEPAQAAPPPQVPPQVQPQVQPQAQPQEPPQPAPPTPAHVSALPPSAAPHSTPRVASESKATTAPAAPIAPKPPTLDLSSLEQRLKDTRAIGVFTKLSLKNQVDDLLSELRAFHKGTSKTPQSELRQKYDLLILKVLSLLQNGDPQLATAIASSREAIWGILMDPNKFAKI
jgi:outer membrane biosynthesis protein TonB